MPYSIILAVCLLLFGVCVGKMFSNRLNEKYIFYKSLCDFNCDLLNEVCFFKNNIKHLCKKEYISESFNDIIKQKSNAGAIAELLPDYLNKTQKSDILSYFEKIGKTDSCMQTATCEGYKVKFFAELNFAREQFEKYAKLYNKTGLLIGLIAFVIVI